MRQQPNVSVCLIKPYYVKVGRGRVWPSYAFIQAGRGEAE